jgi:uncharacterized membrane protein YczE
MNFLLQLLTSPDFWAGSFIWFLVIGAIIGSVKCNRKQFMFGIFLSGPVGWGLTVIIAPIVGVVRVWKALGK